MKRRMTMATAAASVALMVLSGCTDDAADPEEITPEEAAAATTASAGEPSPVPSVDSSSKGAIAVRGEWANDDAQWVVQFHEDGTFTEDLGEVIGFRTGSYEVEGDVVKLHGTDGKTVEGTVKGEKLVFKRATLERL